MLAIHRISGESMSPHIQSGDYVVLLTGARFRLPAPAMLVVFDHPLYGSLLKQVVYINQTQRVFSAQGLNALSVNHQYLSHLPFSCIKGQVVWKISQNYKGFILNS